MDAKLNITLEDILKEEDDDVGVDPNVSVSVDAILNEPDDDITEKIFQTLKENLPLSQTLRSEEYRNAQDSNAHQNSTDALSKYSTSNSLSHATSPISSNSSKAFLNKSSSIETVSSAQHEQVAPSASTNVSGSFETTASEMKIDGEALQQILKETEDLNFKDLDEGTIDIDNLIHSMLLEEKMAAGSRGDDLLAQISAKEKQLINVEESKKLLEHLEQKRRKRKLQSNILDFMHLESISKKLSSPQMKNSAGIPCSIAISNKYIAVGTSHGFVIVFDHFHELQCVMIPQEDVEHGPVLSLDISSDSEWIVCGHQGGQLVVWDIAQRKPIKSLTDEHQNPIVLVRFLKTKDRFISVDTAGVVNYTTITRILLVYTASTQCILSGVQGQVFSVAVLLPGSIPHPIDSLELVALCTALKTIVVSFQSDKVKIVHQIPRPEGVREETLPHVAWRRVVIRETRGGQRKLMDPMLAIAWGNKIDLIQVLLTPKVETLPRYALEFASLQSYRTDAEICGLQWLGVNTIAFLTNSDELRVLDSSLLEEVEISNVKHMEIAYHTKFGMSRLCFANSMRSYKGHLYLLGLKGIWTGHLLTWSERLSALAKRSQWLDALSLAFDFYQGRSVGAEGLPRDPHIAKNLISKKIEELLEQFLSLGLSKNKTDSAPFILENEQPSHHHQYLATVSIDYCIALGRDDLLFNLVFPLFFKANEVGVFLERLEPFILGDKIQRLPPEIVKLLLHHYTTNKLFRRLEQLILHIPIPSLDFHQVVTLCRKHYLMSALFYVFIQALNDYITPLDDLIKILLKIETQKQSLSQEQQTLQKTIGYKVLIYLSYCFSGKSFPTEVPIAPDRWQTLCDEIFQYLLIESLDDIDFKYPRLHVLLQVDTKEFLRVMSICIDANFSTTSSNTTSIVLSKLVAVLLQLMVNTTEEAFSWSDQPKNASALYSPTQVGCFFRFLAQYFARKMIDLSAYLLNRVLSHLLLSTDKTTAKERETILLSLVKSYNDDRYNQDKILRLAEDANFYKVCEYFYWKRKDFSKVFRCHLVDPDYQVEIFDYIRKLMDDTTLSASEKNAFKNVIIANLKDLIELDNEKASELIIEKFAPEHNRVIDELRQYPQLQYIYLNTVLEYHRKGALKSESVKGPTESPLTPEQEEKLLELMCQYNPQKVLNFLQHQGSHYRLDVALQICQKQNVSEATAYLLERSGDLKGALKQHLNLIQPLLNELLTSVGDMSETTAPSPSDNVKANPTDSMVGNSNSPMISTSQNSRVERDFKHEIDKAIALCQRNSQRLEESENEALWFMLLDCLVKPWRQLKEFDSRLSGSATSDTSGLSSQMPTERGAQNLRSTFIFESSEKRHTRIGNVRLIQQQRKKIEKSLQLLNGYVQHVLDNMMGYVAMPSILKKIVKDHGSDNFGEFKAIFISMLDNYLYEQNILTTATHLFEYDTYRVGKQLLQLRRQARFPLSNACQVCKEVFKPWNKIAVFQCHHAFHFECLIHNKSSASDRQAGGSKGAKVPLLNGCPLCGSTESEETSLLTTTAPQTVSTKSAAASTRQDIHDNINRVSQRDTSSEETKRREPKPTQKTDAMKTKPKIQEDIYKQRVNKLVIPQESSRYNLLKRLENEEKETSEVFNTRKRLENEALAGGPLIMLERTPGVLSVQRAKYTSGLSEEQAKELFKLQSGKRK